MSLKFWRCKGTPPEQPKPREPITITVQDAEIHIWAHVSDTETMYAKTLRPNPFRNRFGDVEIYPAIMAVNDFFSNWKSHGFAVLNDGYVVRWEDFLAAKVRYGAREVTPP